MDDLLQRVRTALAGRYSVEREIGAGGMARVYLARDAKHDRDVAVKVLDPAVSASIGSERFLREIAIAAGFTHPHIIPVHDSGEADGLLYFVMPYLEGESLQDRLDREKQLPVEDAVRIGREVAEALAYAHGHGVVHRDIKPANILLSSGQAVVADFGIARALEVAADMRLTRTGLSPGTPLYMSPEQISGGEVDGRSDVYALGCVIYEMLTGTRPHEGSSLPALVAKQLTDPVRPIHEVRDTVPPGVENAVMKSLARLPADRFGSADEMASALTPTGGGEYAFTSAGSRLSRRAWAIRLAAVLVPTVILLSVVLTRSAEGIDFAERDWIVIADLVNETGDEVFDRSLNTALTVAVSQSRYVNVYPRGRVQETLRRMGRDPGAPLDEELALEVADREHLKAVLAFDISSVGETYIVSTRVLAPETGVAVYSESVQAEGKDDVLGAVDELARRLRSNLGESLLHVRRRSVPLPQATTTSLDALKRYTDGSVAWSGSRWEEARSFWGEAVALDSTFAWAHASLGLAANWLDGPGAGQPHFDRALSLLDRVSERERLWIRSLIEDGEPMVETLRIFTQLYPDDRDGWYNLGNGLRSLERLEEAVDAYGRSLAVDSLQPWAYNNRALAYDALGRYEEAAQSFAAAFRLNPPSRTQTRGDLNRISGFILAKVGDTVGARETFELVLDAGPDERANGLRSLALLDLYRGRAGSAVERLREAVGLSESIGALLSEYRNRLYLAAAYTLRGMESEARGQRDRAHAVARDIGADPFWLQILGKQAARAGELERAAEVLDRMDAWPGAGPERQYRTRVDQVRGEVAMARGDFDEARPALERARAATRSPDVLESLAWSLARGGHLAEAAAAYEELLSTKPLGDEAQAYWLGAHVELGRIYEAQGDAEKAAGSYRALIELWRDGDPELPLLLAARERLEALGT